MIRRPPRSTLFPTRRSSDLNFALTPVSWKATFTIRLTARFWATVSECSAAVSNGSPPSVRTERSEEHTSELQSQSNLVCRLLLEKKKQQKLPRRRATSTTRE